MTLFRLGCKPAKNKHQN